MQEKWVQSLVREDPLEKEIATHSPVLAWEIPWTEEPGKLQFRGSQRVAATIKNTWNLKKMVQVNSFTKQK